MCSIAGAKNPSEVEKMLEIMKHRSPDGVNFISDEKYTIGMGRLSIVGEYEFPYRLGKYTLTFNGEIFNYKEIRDELKKKGVSCETTSDAEVLLRSYIEWGEKCLLKFNGMFAFAIYDGDTIFFARDVAGEKPFYYTKRSFSFASEAKALGVCEELPHGHYGIYDVTRESIQIFPYWKLERIDIPKGHEEEMLEEILEDAVKLRVAEDVPYALYYSGGVDSSLINTFHEFEKLTYTNKNAKNEFLDVFPKIVWHLDYPINSFSAFGLWKLAEQAHNKGYKVVISGEGADELFGGYVRYVKKHFNYLGQNKFPSYKDMFRPAENVDDAGWREFHGNMQELLRMGDRMASAWGVENRCPFLDKRVIQFAFSLREDLKISGLDTKVILNRILKRRNPEYVDIEKAGLFCSVNEWIGSKQKYEKDDYLKYQKAVWRDLQL